MENTQDQVGGNVESGSTSKMKEVHNKPEIREKHKNAMKAVWADPEKKAKIIQAMKTARAKKLQDKTFI